MKKITGNTIVGFLFAAAAGITLYISNATLKSASAMGDPGPKMFPNAMYSNTDSFCDYYGSVRF